MSVALRRIGGWRVLLRGIAVAALALGAAACASIQNMMPDPASFRLPDRTAFIPTNTTAYAGPVSAMDRPVGPTDLVDGQGQCTGAAQVSPDAVSVTTAPGSVGLEMTECAVVRALGQPQSVEISPQAGRRSATLTYTSGERAGIYQFTGGRLVAIDRGNEPPPPPPVAKKPPARKPKPPA